MSSLEDEETEKTFKKEFINSEVKDQLNTDLEKIPENSCLSNESNVGEEMINRQNSLQNDSENTLQTRKDRKQPTKTKICDKFPLTHPCVPKINCSEKIVR